MDTFKAIVLNKDGGQFTSAIEQVRRDALPAGDVVVRVAYSSLNYKDGLAVTGSPGVVRSYPMVPGIDLGGTVEASTSSAFTPGDRVVMTACGAGDAHWGGYAELARVKAEWLVPLPDGLTLSQAMGVGTAGFTAMQSVMALEARGLQPDGREVLVTGAAGGVGSISVAILKALGYTVTASTGRAETHPYLRALGADEIIDRAALTAPSKKALEAERWSGAIDSVGGQTLATVLRQLAHGASVAACGMAGGGDLPTTVFPFILRGVGLAGIDSVHCDPAKRRAIWTRIAQDLPAQVIDSITSVATLEDVPSLGREILQGHVRGRTIIEVR
jgi:acrylyl-CoA reductase (NADPH)